MVRGLLDAFTILHKGACWTLELDCFAGEARLIGGGDWEGC